MIELQLFGGRGAGSASGRYKGGGGVNPANIVSTRSLLSAEGKTDLINDSLQVFKDVSQEYGYDVTDIQLATLKGKDRSTLAYYDFAGNVAINESYFNKNMEKAYIESVKDGFHPSNGNKTGLQAVTAHELGHGLTDKAGKKYGKSLDAMADQIVNEARKKTNHKGVVQMSSKISRYATASNAEAISEAFADVYCNGKKAKRESRAIISVLNKYAK